MSATLQLEQQVRGLVEINSLLTVRVGELTREMNKLQDEKVETLAETKKLREQYNIAAIESASLGLKLDLAKKAAGYEKQDMDKLKEEKLALGKAKENLEDTMLMHKVVVAEFDERIQYEEKVLENKKADIEQRKSELSRQADELAYLQDQLSAALKEHKEQIEQDRKKLNVEQEFFNELQSDLEKRQDEIEKANAERENNQILRDQIHAMESEMRQINMEHEKMISQLEADLQKQKEEIVQKERQITFIKEITKHLADTMESTGKECIELKSQKEALEYSNRQLKTMNADILEELEAERMTNVSLQVELKKKNKEGNDDGVKMLKDLIEKRDALRDIQIEIEGVKFLIETEGQDSLTNYRKLATLEEISTQKQEEFDDLNKELQKMLDGSIFSSKPAELCFGTWQMASKMECGNIRMKSIVKLEKSTKHGKDEYLVTINGRTEVVSEKPNEDSRVYFTSPTTIEWIHKVNHIKLMFHEDCMVSRDTNLVADDLTVITKVYEKMF